MLRDESLSVLVVDDSDFFRSLLTDKLASNYGMGTVAASDAAEAMSVLDGHDVDCVVSDYEMPGTSGIELYEMVDGQYDVPFVLLTAEGDEEVASRAIRVGIDEYLLKQSVSEEEPLELLVNRIRNVVEQRRTQRRYELLVDNSPDEIARMTLDGEILAANESLATAHGVEPAEMVGEPLAEFVPRSVAENRLQEGRRAVTAGSAVTFQDSIGVRHFHNIAVPLSTGSEDESIQLVTRDITVQKHNERELERKSEELTLINRIVRHDINNDVQLLMAWAETLDSHVDEAGVEYLDRIGETSEHIAELTAIARDFVESLEEDSDLALDPVDVGRVLEREVEKKRATFEGATITAADLPNATVRANELLSSVFGNLLNNAVRHNDAVAPEVWVEATEHDGGVTVRVADNGPGVPEDRRVEIFGKGTLGPESPGTGVGLYLVYTLVDQYGGDVWVEDSDRGGAAFVVELPKHPAERR